jgi:hypothetical protein
MRTFLRFGANVVQHSHARFKVSRRNSLDQFMAQLQGRCIDPFNYTRGSSSKVHGFASTIVFGIAPENPAGLFQAMKQINQRWLFDAETSSDFGLSQCGLSSRKMQQRAPLGLAQTHRLQALIQL